jgi:hypothetical protein
MPDFEIRYFLADDSLALVRVNAFASDAEAEVYARANQEHYARFEIRRAGATPVDAA